MNDLYSGGILEDLYRGDLHPQDRDVDPRSEYAAFQCILADNERKLTAFLETIAGADEERRLFTQLLSARQEIAACDELDRFIKGFPARRPDDGGHVPTASGTQVPGYPLTDFYWSMGG